MKQEDLFQEALTRFEATRLHDWEQRKLAVEDSLFINAEDGQWSEDVVTKRKDRPRYTIDRISGAIDQIVGNQRQTRTGIRVSPQKDGDAETADIYSGLIRSIEEQSHANNTYDSAFDETITCGFGGWRVLTDFETDDSFEQVILIKPISSASTSLYFDPTAKEYDKRDSRYAFVISYIMRDAFQAEFPDASITDFSAERYKSDNTQHWFGDRGIRIAEYWYKVPIKRKIGLLSDGRTIDLKEEEPVLDELAAQGIKVIRERNVDSHTIEMVIMNGAEVLTKPQKWAGKFIPLVPVFGRSARVNDRNYTRGIVRKSKDAQRIYNYATSSAIESTSLSPKDPIWITPDQAKGHELSLRTFPTQNSPFMMYNPDPTAPGPPSRGGAPQVQTALLQQVSQAAQDIHATTGLEPSSLGSVPVLKSGKAIQAEQAMGDRGSFLFQDNLQKSQQYTGEILVDLIPRIYDTERVVKVLGPDEVLEDVTVNQPQSNQINDPIIDEQTGEQVLVNDLSQGSYSVAISSGPSFSTKRKETVDQLVNLAGQSPIIQELALDLIIENMDLNKGDEIKTRIRKKMVTDGLVEPTEKEVKDFGLDQQKPDPMNSALVKNLEAQTEQLQIQNEKIISEVKKNDAATQASIINAQKDSVSALTDMMETFLKKVESGAQITENEIDLIDGQQALVAETQGDVIEGQELAGSAPIGKPDPMGPPGQFLPPEQPAQQMPPEIPPGMITQ